MKITNAGHGSNLVFAALLALSILTTGLQAAETPPAGDGMDFGGLGVEPTVLETQGFIQLLDFNAYTVVISGMEYEVSQTVKVEINGSYGAFTMLEPGMGVKFLLELMPDGSDRVTEIIQINDAIDF